MHHHSGPLKLIGMITCFITIIGAIILGLTALNIDVFQSTFVQTNIPWIVMPALYVILISGVLSLIFYFIGCCTECDVNHKGSRSHHSR